MKIIDRRGVVFGERCANLPGRAMVERLIESRNARRWDALEALLAPAFQYLYHGGTPLRRSAYIEQLLAQARVARDTLSVEDFAVSSAGFSVSIITHRYALADGVPGFDKPLRRGENVRTLDFAFFDVTGNQVTEIRATRMDRAL